MSDEALLIQAKAGDIAAFQELFTRFQGQLRSFLYRTTADRLDAEDLTHDTFVSAFEKVATFRGQSGLKTWVFRIGTNLARDLLRARNRWPEDAQDRAKALAIGSPEIQQNFAWVHAHDPRGSYDIREHIDFCFTCIGKTLPLDQQVALLLKDVYAFKRTEIATVLGQTEGVVKHLLHDARRSMQRIFANRCALINKEGTCHQCSELAGIYNPRQARRELKGPLPFLKS